MLSALLPFSKASVTHVTTHSDNSDTQELVTLVTSCLALIDECYRAPAPAAAQTALLQAKLGAAELQPHPGPGGHCLLHPILHLPRSSTGMDITVSFFKRQITFS